LSLTGAALERVVAEAEALLAQSRVEEAQDRARVVLSNQPRNARAHYLLAVCALRAGRQDEALDHIAAALRFDRVNPQYHELAASCHAASGRWDEAISAQRRVLQYRSGDASAWGSLGYFERMAGRAAESLAALARALEIAPGFAAAHNERAMSLVQAGRKEEGIAALRRAVALDPGFLTAWRNLAKLLYLDYVAALQRAGGEGVDGGEARSAIEGVLALDPDDVEFGYLRDALNQVRVARPPDAFVEGFFDRFAPQFDERLVGELGYTGPEAVRDLLAPYLAPPHFTRRLALVLDLGCGTGLSGAILREASARLVGVDLSSGMLAKARERGLYDDLVHAEIGDYLEGVAPGSVDLVLALEVFIYVGELERVVARCAAALVPGGLFAFSTESLAQGDYVLQPLGRYAHSDAYVRAVAGKAAFDFLEARDVVIRTEANRPVAATLYLFRKPG
jgi:predicted TPR repeat methyltransferase